MDRKELETFQVQLSQVELALASDPENEELTALRSELKELISSPRPPSHRQRPPHRPPRTQRPRHPVRRQGPRTRHDLNNQPVRRRCRPVTSAWQSTREMVNGILHGLRLWGGSDERRVFNVVFKGYNSTELLDASALKPMPAGGWKGQHAAAAGKRRLTQEEEEERERKKKKNEKKLEVRAAKAKEQNNKQAAWQKFAKKSEKKGVVIAGMQGTSIFKTPDNPHGRVGVTGSGKGMTEYASREKHKFSADDAAS
ncbi:splicing protein SMN [Ceratobasidium sp. AG-Ba]|nr:splicing protein SMN [Ceratobasidium sp. AG-Ba]